MAFRAANIRGTAGDLDAQGGPLKEALNSTPKYVASTTLEDPLPWPNSALVRGDIAGAVRARQAQSTGVLAIMGSGELIGSLIAADLIDECLPMIHPLVLGTGRRLFPENLHVALRLTHSMATPAGVVISTYEPTRAKGAWRSSARLRIACLTEERSRLPQASDIGTDGGGCDSAACAALTQKSVASC